MSRTQLEIAKRGRSNIKDKVLKWTVLFSLFAARLVPNRNEPVRISGGLVQGLISPNGMHVAYFGIPYATVGQRFQSANPDAKWEGVFQAQNENIRCTQRFFKEPALLLGYEDCLTLNVYAPLLKPKKPRSVMVFIHGGGFKEGSGSPYLYGPEYFLKHDVILVTINYRLDILGFLCLGIKEAPGNVGLKDQVEALRWVQKNIKSFGGDPNSVTIFGESAGAASVSYHLLSPMSKGLFGKVIMQSGTALAPWAFQYDPVKFAHKFAQELGQDKEDLHELVLMLKNKSDKELIDTIVPRVAGEIALEEYNFVPCVEKEIEGVERFLPEHPYDLISKGNYTKVPIIMGYNDEEGYWFVSKDNETMLATFDFVHSIPRYLQFSSESEKSEVGNKLKSLYLPNREISKETKIEFSRYLGDAALIFPVMFTIEEFLRTSQHPVYVYKFTHDGRLNFAKTIIGFKKYPGAAHADDLFYLFKSYVPIVIPSADVDIIDKMSTMWTNFAKYSDPTPLESSLLPIKWVPASSSNQKVFILDNEFSYTHLYDNERLIFWKSLYTKHLRK